MSDDAKAADVRRQEIELELQFGQAGSVGFKELRYVAADWILRLERDVAALKERFVGPDGTMMNYSEWIILPRDSDRLAENERLRVAFETVDAEARYLESMSHDYEPSVGFMDRLREAIEGGDK